jgi:hypothetical protein
MAMVAFDVVPYFKTRETCFGFVTSEYCLYSSDDSLTDSVTLHYITLHYIDTWKFREMIYLDDYTYGINGFLPELPGDQ